MTRKRNGCPCSSTAELVGRPEGETGDRDASGWLKKWPGSQRERESVRMGVCECVRVCMGMYACVCARVIERVCGC